MTVPGPEMSADAAEQRLIIRFHEVWQRAAGGKAMPSLKDFSGDELEPFKPFSVVIDLQEGYDSSVIRHVGSAIARLMGEDFKGRTPGAVPRRTILSRITDHFYEVLANGAPVGFEANFTDDKGKDVPYRGILTPLSDDGETINFILAAINWAGAPPWNPDARPQDLAAELRAILKQAADAGRGRNELYDLLTAIYGFYIAAREDEEGYSRLLKNHGIRAQARAPFTAALKLALGADYDKTRLTEYAAAMSWANRQGLDRDAFLAALHNTPGGLKALVRAERSVRGNGGASSLQPADAALRDLPARAWVENWEDSNKAEDDGYVILLARRAGTAGENLAVLDAAPAKARDLDRFAKRLARN